MPVSTPEDRPEGAEGGQVAWIIELAGSPDPQHFGPFVDEDDALGWGFEHLADFEPEDWEPYELSLKPPSTPGGES